MPIIVNKISRNKLLKFKNLMKLSIGVIVLLFSINILYQMKPNAASAMAGTIFDRGSRTRYFSGTSGIEFHNVLPAIYNFRRNREESGVQYAVNMNILLGISDSELWNQWKDSKNVKKYGTVKDLAGAIETFEEYSRTTANIGKPQNFTEYSQFMEANKDNPLRLYSVGPINQCIQTIHNKATSTAPTNPKIITSASEYNTKREKCIKWFDTGFRFLKYSLAGVKQSNKGAFNEAYSAVKADNQTEVTIQKMGFGGELYNQYTKKNATYTKFNTAINEARDDVIGYDLGGGTIHESMAVVVWGNNSQGEKEPVWVLRLACANPVAGASSQQGAQVAVNVKGQPNPVHLPKGSTAKVTFKYKIHKKINGYPGKNTTINYQFSSDGPMASGTVFNQVM